MKNILLTLIFLLLTHLTFSQDSLSLRQEKVYKYLLDSCDNRIDFGCYNFGHYSDNLFLIRQLQNAKRIDFIKQLLDSKTPATKYLATETLLFMQTQNQATLDISTNQRIDQLRHSNEKIVFCSGCTNIDTFKIKKILSRQGKKIFFVQSTKDWIRQGKK